MSDAYLRNREYYGDHSGQFEIAATDTGTKTFITCKAGHSIFVQKMYVNVVVGNAGKTLTVEDNASSPLVLAILSGAAAGPLAVLDFGARGVKLTEGKNLVGVISAANAGYEITFEAYQKLTAVGAA